MIILLGITIDSNNENYKTDGKAVYNKEGTELIRYYSNETTITLSEGLKSIYEYAFRNKSNITSIIFPESLEELQPSCFSGCSKLKSLNLGKNVSILSSRSIYSSGVENIVIDEENVNYTIIDGALYNKDGTIFISPIKKIKSNTTYDIPEGIKEIADYAFQSQPGLKAINLPSTIEKIGSYSFGNCTSLTSIEIPSSIKSIAVSCFTDCGVNLTEIIIHKPQGSISGSPWGCQYGERAVKWDS